MIRSFVVCVLVLFSCICAQQEWIFGYGSLMSQSSRNSTYPDIGIWRPVRVVGINRGWYAPGTVVTGWSTLIGQEEQLAPTYLGAYIDNVSLCNGVIFQVNATGLAKFDNRELSGAGYNRATLPVSTITPVDNLGPINSNDIIYFYNVAQNLLGLPSETSPIVSSYVDLSLTATLLIDTLVYGSGATNFTEDFVNTTQAWSGYWVNDRLLPRRPWVYQSNALTIDKILAKYLLPAIIDNITYDDVALQGVTDKINALQAQVNSLQNQINTMKSAASSNPVELIFLVVVLLVLLF